MKTSIWSNAYRKVVEAERWAFFGYTTYLTTSRVGFQAQSIKKGDKSPCGLSIFSRSTALGAITSAGHPLFEISACDNPHATNFGCYQFAGQNDTSQSASLISCDLRSLTHSKQFITAFLGHGFPPCRVLYTVSCMKIVCMITYLKTLLVSSGELAMSKNLTIAILALALAVSLIAIFVLATMLSDQRSHVEKVESVVGSLIAGQTVQAGATQTAALMQESTRQAFDSMLTKAYEYALETVTAELTRPK
jgi:hypothetical protein